ncbi:MAG TPA: SDR family NAD(P)-dependent oxidoreductase, partial [bacterium]
MYVRNYAALPPQPPGHPAGHQAAPVAAPSVPMPIFPDLRGKVAVVTGASRGIGAAVARQFAVNGMRVVLSGRDAAALEAVATAIRAEGGQVITAVADCTREGDLLELRQRAEWEWDAVDVVAAIAGGNGHPRPTEQVTLADWRAVVDANLTATFLTIQAFLPRMLERGQGNVITMASAAGRQASLAAAAYGASKAGVVMLTRHLAREFGPRGVRFNCIAPSAIATASLLDATTPEQRQAIGTQFPLGRIGTPEDVAHAALYLASAASGWVTGV